MADRERLRGLGAGRPCLAGGGSGQGGHDVHRRADGVPGRSRDPLGSRDPGRQGGGEAGQVARARGCVSASGCAREHCVRAGAGGRARACACLRASASGVCAGACVGVRVCGHACALAATVSVRV